MDLKQKIMGLPLWGWISAAVLVFFVGAAIMYYMPQYGTWRYGACRVFLERYVRFPTTISVKFAGEKPNAATLGFTDVNPFGSRQIRILECHYSIMQNGVKMTKITIDRKALPDEVVNEFNKVLPIVLASDLDTKLPKPFEGRLEDAQKNN